MIVAAAKHESVIRRIRRRVESVSKGYHRFAVDHTSDWPYQFLDGNYIEEAFSDIDGALAYLEEHYPTGDA